MLSTGDILNGFRSVLAMARNRPDWAEDMAMDADAVWRSFWVIPLALPSIILVHISIRGISVAIGNTGEMLSAPPWIFVAEGIVTTLIMWALVVGFYIQVGKRLEIGTQISPVLIANNYANLMVQGALSIGLGLLYILGAYDLIMPFFYSVLFFSVWLDWGILRRAMGLRRDGAVMTLVFFQILALVISLIIGTIVLGLLPAQS